MEIRKRLSEKQRKQQRREQIRAELKSGYVLTTHQYGIDIDHTAHPDLESLKQDLENVRLLSIPIVRIRQYGRTLSESATEEPRR